MALSTITPIKRSEEYLQRIADAIEGGQTSPLPAVTSSDNGDVLTVVDGAWDKASPAGGGALVVSASHIPDTAIIQLSETFDTIEQAMLSGQNVIVAVPVAITDYMNEGAYTVLDVSYTPDLSDPEYDQYAVNVSSGGYAQTFQTAGRNAYPQLDMS